MIKLERFKTLWLVIWVLSVFTLISGLIFITDTQISDFQKTVANLFVQVGGAFFFALTAGYVFEKIQNAEGYSLLWLFSQEFRKAGLVDFYADRDDDAEKALKEAFEKHRKGEVLLAGASLRVFLVQGQPFYSKVESMLNREGSSKITVKALTCNPEKNRELPFRSFIEEFNQDGSFPKKKSLKWDWEKKINFSFSDFEQKFFKNHGIYAPSKDRLRVNRDLDGTRGGIIALKGIAEGADNSFEHREFECAPYCTVIIFPGKAFYTANIFYNDAPANLPMMVFHKSSEVYKKLVTHVKFMWWVSDPDPDVRLKNA
jgi:hypothetical protein